MYLAKINLENFRNFTRKSFSFSPFFTLVIGENSKGKTNLIESAFFLLNGLGFREEKEIELIFFNKNKGFVDGFFQDGDDIFNFKIILENNKNKVEKNFYLNKAKKTYFQYKSNLPKAVLFSPEQIEIINGSPKVRRDYIDKFISSYDLNYKRYLLNYENSLKRRNKILEKYQDEKKLEEELVFWNDYLEKQGQYLTKKREEYIDFLNKHSQINEKNFIIKYLKNEFNKERLKKFLKEERYFRKTLIGPQKDDFQIFEKEKNIHIYGSRSEQRMALFWLKINEINYFQEKLKKRPIILLDDIFSELDFHHKKIVLNLVKKYQTIATTTEIEVLEMIEVPKMVIKI